LVDDHVSVTAPSIRASLAEALKLAVGATGGAGVLDPPPPPPQEVARRQRAVRRIARVKEIIKNWQLGIWTGWS
jgi:cytosine/adenosine deaminase-related metal-dependent hydrolase